MAGPHASSRMVRRSSLPTSVGPSLMRAASRQVARRPAPRASAARGSKGARAGVDARRAGSLPAPAKLISAGKRREGGAVRCPASSSAAVPSETKDSGQGPRQVQAAFENFIRGHKTRARSLFLLLAKKLQAWKLPLVASRRAQLLGLVQFATMVGVVSKKTNAMFAGLYDNYSRAVVGKNEGVDEAKVLDIMKNLVSCVFKEFLDPYEFPSYHSRILGPFNYYRMGQQYCSPLIDMSNSYVGHVDKFQEISDKLAAGENAILLANHQTEADPGVFALLLERDFPELAQNVIYVAGDRVVSDPLAKPFSMGRNLLCVHSKKYLDEHPELKASKQKQNRMTLVTMQKMLNQGGQLIWIAPSGGRDRPKEDGTWAPSAFDPSTVELMRKLANNAKSKTSLYPFAMWSWKIFPPPATKQVELGEERICNHSGVAVSLRDALEEEHIVSDAGVDPEDKEQVAAAFLAKTEREVRAEYAELDRAIEGRVGTAWEADGYRLMG